MENQKKCPVMHGAMSTYSSSGTSNKDWWPNQLNISILHQHDKKTNPMGEDFNYRNEFKKIDKDVLKITDGQQGGEFSPLLVDKPKSDLD